MKLQDMMIRNVIQIAPAESIGTAAKRMSESAVGCLVVTVNDAVKGIITDRDLLGCLAQKHDPYRCEVSAHMRRPVIILGPEDDHKMAAKVLHRKKSDVCLWRKAESFWELFRFPILRRLPVKKPKSFDPRRISLLK
jgi:CBS domain-containing protein